MSFPQIYLSSEYLHRVPHVRSPVSPLLETQRSTSASNQGRRSSSHPRRPRRLCPHKTPPRLPVVHPSIGLQCIYTCLSEDDITLPVTLELSSPKSTRPPTPVLTQPLLKPPLFNPLRTQAPSLSTDGTERRTERGRREEGRTIRGRRDRRQTERVGGWTFRKKDGGRVGRLDSGVQTSSPVDRRPPPG